MDTLQDLLAELARFREQIARGEVDRAAFTSRSSSLQARGAAINVDLTDQLNQLRALSRIDIDLSDVVNQLRALDELARSGSLSRADFDEQAANIRRSPIIDEEGQGAAVDAELNRIAEGANLSGIAGSLTDAASAAFLFKQGIGAVTGALNGIIAPIRNAINLQEEFQSNVLKSQILFVSATRAYTETGEEIFSATDRLRQSASDFEELNVNLEVATQSIAGLTSQRLTSVTREVTKNIGLIQNQSKELGSTLEIIEGLVPDIAGALSTLGLPELQDTQEIRELLRGQFNDQRALLGVQLGISKQEADIARQQGRFVDLLRERLRPFVEGNKIASERLGSVLVNFQDSQEILARSFATEFAPPLVEAANNLFTALVVGGENQAVQSQINDLKTLNSLTSQYNSIQEQLANSTGLSDGQIQALNRNLEANRDAFSKLSEEVRALEGTDTGELIVNLNKELANLDPTPFEAFQSLLEDLGRTLGQSVDEVIQQTEALVSVLDSIGLLDAIGRAGEEAINIIRLVNVALGFTTRTVQFVAEGLEKISGVGELVEASFNGINNNIENTSEEFQNLQTEANSVRTALTDLGKSGIRNRLLQGINTLALRFGSFAGSIISSFGPFQRLIGFLNRIPGFSTILKPLISQFGLLGKLLPGIGQALLIIDAFKLGKTIGRELTGANKAVRRFVEQSEQDLNNFANSSLKVRDALRTITDTTTQERRNQIQDLAQLEVDALNAQIKAKEDTLKTDRELRKELEAQNKSEEEINDILENRVNLSNVEKDVREEQERGINVLKAELEGVRSAAAAVGVTLRSTRVEARALQDQGLIGPRAINDFRNTISDIERGFITTPEALKDRVGQALVDAQFLVANGLLPIQEIEEGLLSLSEETNITTEQRKEIFSAIADIRKADLDNTIQQLKSEEKINQLKLEAGLIGQEELETSKAENRLTQANLSLETARAKVKALQLVADQEGLQNAKLLRDANIELAEAEAEQAAANATLTATQGRLEAEQARRAIDENEQLNKQLINNRRRAFIEQGRFFEAEQLQLTDRLESERQSVESADQKLKATLEQIKTTSNETELIKLQTQADRERTALSETRLKLAQSEADIVEKLANLEEQRIRDERRISTELALQERLAGGFSNVSEKNLSLNSALTNVIAERGNLQSLIAQNEQDENKLAKQRVTLFEAIVKARKEILGFANQEIDANTRLALEQDVRDGIITSAEKDLELSIKKADNIDKAIEKQEEFIQDLANQGIPLAEEDNTLAELKLERLQATQNILEANVKVAKEELNLQRRVSGAGERVLSLQQTLLNKISSNIQKQSQELLQEAEGNLTTSQNILQQLQAEEIDEGARLQAIRQLGKLDPLAAAQAAQGRFEAAANSIRRQEQDIARVKEKAAEKEADLAEKRLKIEQAIEQIKLQSRLAEIQIERAEADSIEDEETRRGVLTALAAEENLIGVQQRFLDDPDSVSLNDIGSAFDVDDIDISDVARDVRRNNRQQREGEAEQEAELAANQPLLDDLAELNNTVNQIFTLIQSTNFAPSVTVSPGTTDPNLNTNVIRGEN